MSDKHPCCDLTPNDDCNKTCCPDYRPDSDWCKAFNKRTLEQLKESIQVSIDGMWFNIEDAKNTIAQSEQYLAIIYELLCASLDEVMKASSSAARTEGDFESASVKIKEYMNEIQQIVGGAQYNGRSLLQDTTTAARKHSDLSASLQSTYSSIHPDFANIDLVNTSTITDVMVNADSVERADIHFRLAGARGACRNVGTVFNDFVYVLPAVGVHSLGLSAYTSSEGKDYQHDGIDSWLSSDGIISPDTADDDDVDETVNDFNCAIKTIGVELDKLRTYRYILCLREKQVRIYKEGQNKCYEHKCKI